LTGTVFTPVEGLGVRMVVEPWGTIGAILDSPGKANVNWWKGSSLRYRIACLPP
jgi:hypothetical protein